MYPVGEISPQGGAPDRGDLCRRSKPASRRPSRGTTTGDIGAAIQTLCGSRADERGARFRRPRRAASCSTTSSTSCISACRAPACALKPGMIFTIEPMINLGRPHVKILSDGWTAVTRDRTLSAQAEHSIGITETGARDFYALAARPVQPARSPAARRHHGQWRRSQSPDGLGEAALALDHRSGHRERARQRFPQGRGEERSTITSCSS